MTARSGGFPTVIFLPHPDSSGCGGYAEYAMLTATPATRLCVSCSYWYGPRTASGDGHIYAMENSTGLCQLHEHFDRWSIDYCDDWIQWSIPRIVPVNQQILNCWEYHHCGYEEGGKNAELHGVCPAYPKHGHSCSFLHDAKPAVVLPGAAAQTLCSNPHKCVRCDFFNSGHHEKLIINPEMSWAIPWQREVAYEEITFDEKDHLVPSCPNKNHIA